MSEREFKIFFSEFEMKNILTKPTRINSLIDVMFTNLESNSVCVIDSPLSDLTLQIVELQVIIGNENFYAKTYIHIPT